MVLLHQSERGEEKGEIGSREGGMFAPSVVEGAQLGFRW